MAARNSKQRAMAKRHEHGGNKWRRKRNVNGGGNKSGKHVAYGGGINGIRRSSVRNLPLRASSLA